VHIHCRVDVHSLLPGALSHEDAAELLQLCPAVARATTASKSGGSSTAGQAEASAFASGTCVASGQLMAELAERLKGVARAAAEEQQRQRKTAGGGGSTASQGPQLHCSSLYTNATIQRT